ncbi:MAG: MCE family protein [Alphaproteobacteria bacterium]|nr:MCE family protein [Alphaproteobacteria bacterium]
MRKEPNKRLIGLFIVSGLSVLLIVIGLFLREKIFYGNNSKTLVMYFEESINGLNVGAPVVFKGVQIGKVANIDLIADTNTLDFSIPVYVRMVQRGQGDINSNEFDTKIELLNALIDKGLRARLTTQSYLTGLLMIELEMLPDTKIVRRNPKDSPYLEIPTVLSPIGELSKGIQDLPIRQSVEKFNLFFDKLNNKIMPQVEQIVANVNRTVGGNKGMSAETMTNLNRAINNVAEAAKSMRNFTDYLERHPEALLKGKGRY